MALSYDTSSSVDIFPASLTTSITPRVVQLKEMTDRPIRNHRADYGKRGSSRGSNKLVSLFDGVRVVVFGCLSVCQINPEFELSELT